MWGLYERLDDFIGDFAAFLGVPAPERLAPVNVTQKRPREVSPRLIEKIKALNALDIALYQRLQARYDTARERWRRPAVPAPLWQPLPAPTKRQAAVPEFTLIDFAHIGGGNIDQHARLTFRLKVSLATAVHNLVCLIRIADSRRAVAFATDSAALGQSLALEPGQHTLRFTLMAALPEGLYDVSFGFVDRTPSGDRELAWFDDLARFQLTLERTIPSGGYASLPIILSHERSGSEVVQVLSNPSNLSGSLTLDGCPAQVACGEQWRQPVVLRNDSEAVWQSTHLRPINLSYHWVGAQGEMVIFDGERTPLQGGRLEAGASLRTTMLVKAPEQPGRYRLQALPLVGHVCWFDEKGFTPGVAEIEVQPVMALRRFPADDCRLMTEVGILSGGCRVSDNRNGFLCFGPYVAVAEGRVRVSWKGRFDPQGGVIKLDVAVGRGDKVLAECVLTETADDVTLEAIVPQGTTDLETRVWVSQEARAELEAIIVEPIEESSDRRGCDN